MTSRQSPWFWKVEPESPGFTSPEHEADFWGLDDDVTLSSAKWETSPKLENESKLEVSPKLEKEDPIETKSAAQLLNELDEWIVEEPFAVWLEEKIDLPLFDIPEPIQEPRTANQSIRVNEVKPQTSFETKAPLLSPQYVVPGYTQSLLQEFETVFGEVEHNYGLTPPQSPTHPVQPLQVAGSPSQYPTFTQESTVNPVYITTLQQMIPVQTVPSSTYQFPAVSPVTSVVASGIAPIQLSFQDKKENFISNLEQIVPSPAPDVDEELAAVDELIRSRVEDLESSSPFTEAAVSPIVEPAKSPFTETKPTYSEAASPLQSPSQVLDLETDANSNSSFKENLGCVQPTPSPGADSISSLESYESIEDHSSDDPDWLPVTVHSLPSDGCQKVTGGRKRAAKPYARSGNEEKRLRKKEQNKNAATRYRQKKKAEVEEILTEEKQLAEVNENLQTKVTDLSREIKYLKGLMRDVFKAKGLLK